MIEEARAVGLALAGKALIAAAILLSFFLHSDFANVPNLWNRHYTGADDLSSWYVPFANWDGQHYLLLSDRGYGHAETPAGSRTFFPLYPLLIRALSYLMPRTAAAALLSVLTTAGFCHFLYKLAAGLGCRRPGLVIRITLAFPTAFYASVFYTEGLFLFLLSGFAYHFLVTGSRWAWIYAALLPLTRGAALFVAAGVVAHMGLAYVRAERKKKAHAGAPAAATAFDGRCYAGCLAAFLVGGVLYLAFFGFAAGDPLAGIAAQDLFAVNSIANLLDPGHLIAYLLSETTSWFGARDNLFNKTFVVAALLCCLPFVVWKEWALLCFYLPLVYGQAAMGIGVSFPRFFFVAVPFLALAVARNVSRSWQSWLIYLTCAAMLALQLFLLRWFSLNLWVA